MVVGEDESQPETIVVKVNQLSEQRNEAEHSFDKEKISQRIARLDGGVCTIHVGGMTDLEATERRERIDDAINATRLAIEGGVTVGGGLTLRTHACEVEGCDPLYWGMLEPLLVLHKNQDMLPDWSLENPNVSINFKTMEYEDLLEAGVIDPTEVVVNSLTAAVSIAKLVLLSDTIILPEDA